MIVCVPPRKPNGKKVFFVATDSLLFWSCGKATKQRTSQNEKTRIWTAFIWKSSQKQSKNMKNIVFVSIDFSAFVFLFSKCFDKIVRWQRIVAFINSFALESTVYFNNYFIVYKRHSFILSSFSPFCLKHVPRTTGNFMIDYYFICDWNDLSMMLKRFDTRFSSFTNTNTPTYSHKHTKTFLWCAEKNEKDQTIVRNLGKSIEIMSNVCDMQQQQQQHRQRPRGKESHIRCL